MREISIVGSTGSIGTQTLEVIAVHPDRFRVAALTAYSKAEALFEQVRSVRPRMAGLVVPPREVPQDVRFCQWVFGEECLQVAATLPEADDVLISVVGFAGLAAVLAAFSEKKRVLLANKEALVAGGALVTEAARVADRLLLPVDSEHSAVFQCLRGAEGNTPSRIILTASGGPFRTWEPAAIETATVSQALRHPNWTMGQKITVDSASMLNKALEVIEAHWLFGLPPEKIQVTIHPESIIHSMVEFADGAVLAQMGYPDMRLPILYAMSYPERLAIPGDRLDFSKVGQLTFEAPDHAKFPGLALAYDALHAGGTAGAVLNAANEIAVEAFLAQHIPFGRIWRIVQDVLERIPVGPVNTLEDVRQADEEARRMARKLLS